MDSDGRVRVYQPYGGRGAWPVPIEMGRGEEIALLTFASCLLTPQRFDDESSPAITSPERCSSATPLMSGCQKLLRQRASCGLFSVPLNEARQDELTSEWVPRLDVCSWHSIGFVADRRRSILFHSKTKSQCAQGLTPGLYCPKYSSGRRPEPDVTAPISAIVRINAYEGNVEAK